jgi:hypothetical protein
MSSRRWNYCCWTNCWSLGLHWTIRRYCYLIRWKMELTKKTGRCCCRWKSPTKSRYCWTNWKILRTIPTRIPTRSSSSPHSSNSRLDG